MDDKAFATWCVMSHARPALVDVLRAWRLTEIAASLERAASLGALKILVADADAEIRRKIAFVPLRRDLSHATATLQAGITFATRGDAENTAAVLIGVFAHTASALSWQRPWTRLSWRRRRAEAIARARREQQTYVSAQSSQPPSKPD